MGTSPGLLRLLAFIPVTPFKVQGLGERLLLPRSAGDAGLKRWIPLMQHFSAEAMSPKFGTVRRHPVVTIRGEG